MRRFLTFLALFLVLSRAAGAEEISTLPSSYGELRLRIVSDRRAPEFVDVKYLRLLYRTMLDQPGPLRDLVLRSLKRVDIGEIPSAPAGEYTYNDIEAPTEQNTVVFRSTNGAFEAGGHFHSFLCFTDGGSSHERELALELSFSLRIRPFKGKERAHFVIVSLDGMREYKWGQSAPFPVPEPAIELDEPAEDEKSE